MKTNKIKSVPLRMCIVCKQMLPKAEMLRIVKNKEGEIFIDASNKANGRGAYVCNNPQCVITCLKKRMPNKVFKCEIPDEVYDRIAEEYAEKNK